MTDSYIQCSKLLNFFSQICHFEREREREREREMKCACVNYLHLFVCPPTNNETVNLIILQKHVFAEKYNVAIQYGNYFITIKVTG